MHNKIEKSLDELTEKILDLALSGTIEKEIALIYVDLHADLLHLAYEYNMRLMRAVKDKAKAPCTVATVTESTQKKFNISISLNGRNVKEENIILSQNSTLKDCRTKTIYQSGDWKLKLI